MIALQTANRMPMRIRRVRRLAPIALAAFPIGFALLVASPAPGVGFTAGLAIELLAFGLTAIVGLTGTNQIAAGVETGLDEFEMAARLRAQSEAYRWYGMFVSLVLSLALFAAIFGYPLSTGDDRFLGLFLWVTGYGGILPSWFLAKRLRDEPDADG